ncbi:MAG: transcriptional repressor [Alphaproteobacteria bacterium]|nr:transcriptional repressor [Alphaproteobacteria bacterium]
MSGEHRHAEPDKLTKNQALVFHALEGSEKPLGAYDLLDALRGDGLRSPLQIYRALDKLIGMGLVHRLESLNAFVLCIHCGEEVRPDNAAFTICTACGRVTELNDSSLARLLAQLAEATGFALEQSTVELRGLCAACQAA